MVEELSRFNNICLRATPRTPTIPPDCKRLDVPTLSTDAVCSTFSHIYDTNERPDLINILTPIRFQSPCSPPSHINTGGTIIDRPGSGRRVERACFRRNITRASPPQLNYVSLASPMCQELGPDARGFLGVAAFFPQGVDENNLDWLFPTIWNRTRIFDKFCILSLTYRSNGFITMLAPLRDYRLSFSQGSKVVPTPLHDRRMLLHPDLSRS